MIKLQSILESLLSEVGENTATPYDFRVKKEWELDETWYEWKTDEEGEDPISYIMTISKYTDGPFSREFGYQVEFGIDVEGEGTDYHSTSKTRRTGNMRRVMATVIAALKQEIAKDNKKPGVRVSTIHMSPSKEEETDQRRAKLYLSYIQKNKPEGSTVTYSDRGSIEIKLPKPNTKRESSELNEAFDKPYPTKTLSSGENIETLWFMTSDRYRYEIRFYKLLGHIQKDSAWTVDFKNVDYGSFDITNTGDQMRVFATVINAISDFIERREPEAVQFTASKRDSLSRKKLYTTLVNRYIPDEYELEVSEDPRDFNFSLKRKKNNE